MRAEQAPLTLYRKRNASALAACGGYVVAALFLWAARQLGAQALPDVTGEIVLATMGVVLLFMSTALLTMAALNTPIAIFTHDGVMVGGLRFLFGNKRIVPWSEITSLDTVRLRNRTVMLIQLHRPTTSRERRRAVSLARAITMRLNSDMNFSERYMALPVSEVMAELRWRFANELHDNRIRIRDL